MLRGLSREPLIHFVIVACFVFLFFEVFGVERDQNSETITITKVDIERLQSQWQKRWRRPANAEELQGLINNAVEEELYYREGLRLGLDQGDEVVRNRMIQKMRFLQSEQTSSPTRDELRKWLEKSPDQYRLEDRFSFQHIYLGREISQSTVTEYVARLAGAEIAPHEIDLELSVPRHIELQSESLVSSQFGSEFAKILTQLAIGKWQGPVYSGFGTHLVLLGEIQHAEAASLINPEVRQQVENDWRTAMRLKHRQAFIHELKRRYTLEVADP